MVIARADTGVDSLVLRILQRLGGNVDIAFYGSGKGAYGGPGHCLADFHNRFEVAGTRYRKTGLNNVDTEFFESLGNFDFLYGIQLTARHLFAVAKCSVKNK